MTDNKRIYRVTHGTDVRLIEATSAAAAIQYAATPKYVATPIRPRDLAELMGKGVKVEQVKPDGDAA